MADPSRFEPLDDPPAREDGKCARRGCSKARQVPARTYVAREVHERDPFCSSDCCRIYHRVVMDSKVGLYAKGGGAQKVYA